MPKEIVPVIGMGVTNSVGSDSYPYEVVAILSPTRILVRNCRNVYVGGDYPEGMLYSLTEYKAHLLASDSPTVYMGRGKVGDLVDNNIVLKKGKHWWFRAGSPSSRFYLGHMRYYQDPSF